MNFNLSSRPLIFYICVHCVSARPLRLKKNYIKCKLSTDHYTHRLENMNYTFAALLGMHLKYDHDVINYMILLVYVLFVKRKLISKEWEKIRKSNIYSLYMYSHNGPTLGLEPLNLEDKEFHNLFRGLCENHSMHLNYLQLLWKYRNFHYIVILAQPYTLNPWPKGHEFHNERREVHWHHNYALIFFLFV